MIDTIAVKFGEHDPLKVGNELARARKQVNDYVLGTLRKSPQDTWYGFDVIGKSWWPWRHYYVLKAFRIKLAVNYGMSGPGSRHYSYEIERHHITDYSGGTWKKVHLSIAELLEENKSLKLECVISSIKSQATAKTEKNLSAICQHTAAMDETRSHDEIIECLNKELRFANELESEA